MAAAVAAAAAAVVAAAAAAAVDVGDVGRWLFSRFWCCCSLTWVAAAGMSSWLNAELHLGMARF